MGGLPLGRSVPAPNNGAEGHSKAPHFVLPRFPGRDSVLSSVLEGWGTAAGHWRVSRYPGGRERPDRQSGAVVGEGNHENQTGPYNGMRLLDAEGAARYLSVTVWAIRRWVSQRRIPFLKVGRLTRFDRRDLDELIEKLKVPPGRHPLGSIELEHSPDRR